MKHVKFSLILFLLALAAGCGVRDTLQDCNRTVTIRFSYTGDEEREIFHEKIEHAALYLFDERDVPVLARELTARELETRSAEVALTPGGTYHAVCVGNARDNAALADLYEGTVFDSKIMHPVTHPDIPTGERRVDTHDHLYQGYVNLSVSDAANQEYTLPLASSHIDMVVEVAGFRADTPARAEGDALLYIEHTELPAWTDFSNYCPADDNVSHFPSAVLRDGTYVYEYSVMRNLNDCRILLYDSSDKLVFTVDVTEFLADNPEIDPQLHEALVPIRIEFRDLEVVVSVPQWAIQTTTPEF